MREPDPGKRSVCGGEGGSQVIGSFQRVERRVFDTK